MSGEPPPAASPGLAAADDDDGAAAAAPLVLHNSFGNVPPAAGSAGAVDTPTAHPSTAHSSPPRVRAPPPAAADATDDLFCTPPGSPPRQPAAPAADDASCAPSAAAAAAAAASFPSPHSASASAASAAPSSSPPHTPHSSNSSASAAGAAAAASPPEAAEYADDVQVVRRGYLLKESRERASRNKPWKRRFFHLHGSTLYYYTTDALAGQPRIMVHLHAESEVHPCDSPSGHGLLVRRGETVRRMAAASAAERDAWLAAIRSAREQPRPRLALAAEDAAGASSAMTRLKMSIAGTVASSMLGRAVLKRYLDDSARELIRAVVEFARRHGGPDSSHLEKYLFDIAARIFVVVYEKQLPPDLDLSLLYDETVNFCQDFLTYSRDQRLMYLRGEDAEVVPIDMPELLRAGRTITGMWKQLLVTHASRKIMAKFDTIAEYFFSEDKLMTVLTDKSQRDLLSAIDRSLNDLLARY